MITLRSSNGISLAASLLLALSAQTQLVAMYYAFVCHPETEYGGIIRKPPGTQDWLDGAQVCVQWLCSLLQFVFHRKAEKHVRTFLMVVRLAFVIAFQTGPEGSGASYEPTTATTTTTTTITPTPTRSTSVSGTTATALILLQAALWIAFAIIASKPMRQLGNIAFLIIMSANNYIAIPFSTLATVAAFVCQIRHGGSSISRTGDSSSSSDALSARAVALQGVVFLALAVLWPFRFRLPKNLQGDGWWWVVGEWYPQVGWVGVNNLIVAVGQFIVLYVVARAESDSAEGLSAKRRALLGS